MKGSPSLHSSQNAYFSYLSIYLRYSLSVLQLRFILPVESSFHVCMPVSMRDKSSHDDALLKYVTNICEMPSQCDIRIAGSIEK